MFRLKFGCVLLAVAVFVCCFSVPAYCGDAYFDKQLLAAATRGDTRTVRDSLSKGANIDARDRLGNTPLILAADGGYQEIVRLLLAEKAAVNTVNIFGYTPLLSAVTNSHRYIGSMLVKSGANPDIPNKFGTTARMYIKALGFFTINEYASDAKPSISTLTDSRPERRGATGGLHNAPWREKFNALVSKGKAGEAADYLVKIAKSENTEAQFLLGVLLIEKNSIKEGVQWLEKASQRADTDMLYEIGRVLAAEPTYYDKPFGAALLKMATEQGNSRAGAEYAKILLEQGDYDEAYKLFSFSAERGNSEALFYTGYMTFAGKGLTVNENKGLEIINKSASMGYVGAKDFLNRIALENFIKKAAAFSVGDRAKLRSELLSMNVQIVNGKAGCDTYVLGDAFRGAYTVDKAEYCFPGDGTIKAVYYLYPAGDKEAAAYLKYIAGNAEFVIPGV